MIPMHAHLGGSLPKILEVRPPLIVKKARWAHYDVRDGEMEVIDTINQVNFLRSWVAAHKTDKKMLWVVSVYDVYRIYDSASGRSTRGRNLHMNA